MRLSPEACQAAAGGPARRSRRDLIVLGPGSLYTSMIPNLLISGVAEAIEKSPATCVYIINLMTQPGETRGYTAADHVRAIHRHTRRKLIDWVVVNRQQPSAGSRARRYRARAPNPSLWTSASCSAWGLRCVFDDLLETHSVVRHDSPRLARCCS